MNSVAIQYKTFETHALFPQLFENGLVDVNEQLSFIYLGKELPGTIFSTALHSIREVNSL